jgi:acetyl esterase/lipase
MTTFFSLPSFLWALAWLGSEDKRDYGSLGRSLAAYTSCPVAVPNYRLTQPDAIDDNGFPLRHPAHAHDILQLLTFLLSWSGPQEYGTNRVPPYDPNRLYLIGHSCSAHMLACVLLDSADSVLVPSPTLLRAVRGVVFSEGIYDIDTLLKSFPDYRDWFIRDAFGSLPTYDRYSITRMALRDGAEHIRWMILHSKGDGLVDILQSQAIYDHLQSLYDGGVQGGGQVAKNWDDLEGGHNEILQSGKYIQIVGNFISSIPNA